MKTNVRQEPVPQKDAEVNIKFGTSGWRARMDTGEYTLHNVGRVAQAIAEELHASIREKRYRPCDPQQGVRVLVAFDARKGSEEFAQRVVEVLSACDDIHASMGNDIATTPAVIAMTRESLGREAYDLALHITASHNDTRYNGLKVLQAGVVAPDSLTAAFARRANTLQAYQRVPFDSLTVPRVAIVHEIIARYRKTFPQLVQRMKAFGVQHPAVRIVVDVMHGAAGPYVTLFEEMGATIVRREPMRLETFPQGAVFIEDGEHKVYRPEPKEIFLSQKDFGSFKNDAADGSVYIAIDGDGDRAAVWAKHSGTVHELIPNNLGVLYGWYLHKYHRTMNAAYICKTLPTTNGMRALAAWAGKKLVVTPVGSKFFAPYLKDSAKEKALVGTEESGHHGVMIGDETWFDDATAQSLLLLEIMAILEKNPVECYHAAARDIGFVGYYKRINTDVTPALKEKITGPLASDPRAFAARVAGAVGRSLEAASVTTTNGTVVTLDELVQQKLSLSVNEGIHFQFTDGSWIQLRLSGTEPILRMYDEAASEESRSAMEQAVVRFLGL